MITPEIQINSRTWNNCLTPDGIVLYRYQESVKYNTLGVEFNIPVFAVQNGILHLHSVG